MTDRYRLTIEQRVARIEADFERLGAVNEAFIKIMTDKIAKLEAFVDAIDEAEREEPDMFGWGTHATQKRVDETRAAIDWKARP